MPFSLLRKAQLLLLLSVAVLAQTNKKPQPEAPAWLKTLTVKDFKSPIDQGKFSASSLSRVQRDRIAAALKIPLQDQIEDYPDNNPVTNDPVQPGDDEASRAAARQRLLDRSEILDLGELRAGFHLYVIRVESMACGAQGANCPAFILEASQNQARYLGSAGGWGVAVHAIAGDPYPVLVFAWHMSAADNSLNVMRHGSAGYLGWLCGDLTSDDGWKTSKVEAHSCRDDH
jgi:hypothetical protein